MSAAHAVVALLPQLPPSSPAFPGQSSSVFFCTPATAGGETLHAVRSDTLPGAASDRLQKDLCCSKIAHRARCGKPISGVEPLLLGPPGNPVEIEERGLSPRPNAATICLQVLRFQSARNRGSGDTQPALGPGRAGRKSLRVTAPPPSSG